MMMISKRTMAFKILFAISMEKKLAILNTENIKICSHFIKYLQKKLFNFPR